MALLAASLAGAAIRSPTPFPYFSTDQVRALAADLAAPPAFQRWIVDLVSPGLLRLLQKNMGPALAESGSSLKFGPEEGPEFFVPYGWKELMCVRHSKQQRVLNAFLSAYGSCLYCRSRMDAKARVHGPASASSPKR
jgi:hypothetical protein